jgi:hypothetical protein
MGNFSGTDPRQAAFGFPCPPMRAVSSAPQVAGAFMIKRILEDTTVGHSAIGGVRLLWKYLWKEATKEQFLASCADLFWLLFWLLLWYILSIRRQCPMLRAEADVHAENDDADPLLP